jgi:hypothetical protein
VPTLPGAQPGQIRGGLLIPPGAASDNPSMAFVHADSEPDAAPDSDDALVLLDSVHEELCAVVAGMMGAARGCPPPRSHASFLAMGGSETEAAELAQMVNALFTLDLPADVILRSPTPDALARTIGTAWFDGGGKSADLRELIAAIADAG